MGSRKIHYVKDLPLAESPPLDTLFIASVYHCPRLYTCLSPQHPLSHRFLCPRHLSPNAFTLHTPPSPLPSSPPSSLPSSPRTSISDPTALAQCATRGVHYLDEPWHVNKFRQVGVSLSHGDFPFGARVEA